MIPNMETILIDHYARVLSYVRQKVGADYAEDVTQHVYLRALSAMRSGNGASEHAPGWLWRIVKNCVIDHWRSCGREPEWLELDAPTPDGRVVADEVATPGVSLHERVEIAMQVEDVARALQTLNEEQRVVFAYHAQGYDYQEIGDELGKRRGAIKAQYRRALVNLQVRLGVTPLQDDKCLTQRKHKRTYKKRSLVTVPKKRKAKASPVVAMVQALLLERGPMLPSEVAQILDRQANNIYKLFARNSQFAVVGHVYIERNKKQAQVWGIKGVHDRVEAA